MNILSETDTGRCTRSEPSAAATRVTTGSGTADIGVGGRLIGRLFITAIFLIGLGFAATPVTVQANPDPIMLVDDQGADDEPGQKDLNFMEVDYAYAVGSTGYIPISWGWDDTLWSGKNTGDACSLFDNDGDGFANYSFCVTVDKLGSFLADRLYNCTADSRSDRCGGPAPVTTFSSTGYAGIVDHSDPFGVLESEYYDPAHTTGNVCSNAKTGECYTDDTVAEARLELSDFGNVGTAKLINVCSYPSEEPNSDPSDCVITPNAGFLIIKKVATPNSGTFTFNSSEPSAGGKTQWDLAGSSQTDPISFNATKTLDLTEVLPTTDPGWSLTNAGCEIQAATPIATGTWSSGSMKVDNLEIKQGLETICTFTNVKQATLIVQKVVENGSTGGSAGPQAFSFQVNGGDATAFESDGTNSLSVDAGTYTIAEASLAPGYSFAGFSGDCNTTGSVTLEAGETKTCTLTNTAQQAYITVTKVVNQGTTGGTAQPNDFNLTLGGNAVSSGVAVPVNPGTYTAAETLLSGYSFDGFSGDCNASGATTVALGQSKTCTLTNSAQQAYITVVKQITNDNGGSVIDPDAFLLTLEGKAVSSGVAVPVNPGTYTAAETLLPGYSFDGFSGDCNASGATTVALGQSKTCTLTNDDQKNVPTGTTTMSWVLKDAASFAIRAGDENAGSATITFKLWSNSTCTTQVGATIAPNVTLNAAGTTASADTGAGIPVSAKGTYYWTAEYSGDEHNEKAATDCGSEVTTINETNTTIQ